MTLLFILASATKIPFWLSANKKITSEQMLTPHSHYGESQSTLITRVSLITVLLLRHGLSLNIMRVFVSRIELWNRDMHHYSDYIKLVNLKYHHICVSPGHAILGTSKTKFYGEVWNEFSDTWKLFFGKRSDDLTNALDTSEVWRWYKSLWFSPQVKPFIIKLHVSMCKHRHGSLLQTILQEKHKTKVSHT